MKTTFATIMAAAALAGSSNAFWGTGHLLVSRRAQAILESDSPDAFSQALTVLGYLEQSHASLTEDEGSNPFTECATFADNIKGQGYSAQSDWHFIDQPYLADGGTIADFPDFQMSDVDVVDALTDLTAFLRGDGSSSSVYIKQVQEWFSDENDQLSFALRLVIHYVGDIHQPLHAVSEVDNEYPKGDRGGNSEWIDPNVSGVGNLHSVWDSVIYQYTGYPNLPLSSSDFSWYTSEAASLSSSYPIDSGKILSGEFMTWATESLTIAKSTVYPDFVEHVLPTDEYEAAAKPIIEERLMFGGARLAALIQDIYGAALGNAVVDMEEFLQ